MKYIGLNNLKSLPCSRQFYFNEANHTKKDNLAAWKQN